MISGGRRGWRLDHFYTNYRMYTSQSIREMTWAFSSTAWLGALAWIHGVMARYATHMVHIELEGANGAPKEWSD